MKSIYVYIVGGNEQYRELFEHLGYILCNHIESADLVCFTGGADVSPDLYGDKKHPYTGNDVHRDTREKRFFEYCAINKIPMVGICRGGQFLNVMSGGRMYQDVTGHGMSHELIDLESGEVVSVSSTHHQMIMPSDEAIIVATSINVESKREWYDNQVFRKDINSEGVEVVYYPHTNCLCFQPHPEFLYEDAKPMKQYFQSLLVRFQKLNPTKVCHC